MHISIENPSSLLFTAPLGAMFLILGIYIRRNGIPQFNVAVSAVLLFFGVVLSVLTSGAFAQKLYSPDYESVLSIKDEYLAMGGSIGFAFMIASVCVHLLPRAKGTAPKDQQ